MSGRETTMMEGGGTVCCCRAAVTSLARKLTQLMDSRPAARDALQELATDDEHVAAWKMILEMAYGIEDWTGPKVATELGKPETERERIEEIQAEISEARRRCRRSRIYRLVDEEAAPTSDADHVADGTKMGAPPREAALDNGLEREMTVVSGDSYSMGSVPVAASSSPAVRYRSFPPIKPAAASARGEPATVATAHQVSSSTMAATASKKPGAASRVAARDHPPPRDAYASTEGGEVVEEFFGELWAVPACHFEAANKQHSSSNRGRLVWIRRELFGARTFTAEDCYPARASDRRLPVPKDFSFSQQVLVQGRRTRFASC